MKAFRENPLNFEISGFPLIQAVMWVRHWMFMSIYSAGFFGLIALACVAAFKFFYLGSFRYTSEASEYMKEVDTRDLKKMVVKTITEKNSFSDEFSVLIHSVNAPTVISEKCSAVKPSQTKDCEFQLRSFYQVITIENTHPGWIGVCEKFHLESSIVYECISNFVRNRGWTRSSLISQKENIRIEKCFRRVPKTSFTECIETISSHNKMLLRKPNSLLLADLRRAWR